MDDIQKRITIAALQDLAHFGFVLAGGQSLQAHGLIDRQSADLDLFTDRLDPAGFKIAVSDACQGVSRVPQFAGTRRPRSAP